MALFEAIGVCGCVCTDPTLSREMVQDALQRNDISCLLVSKLVSQAASDLLEEHKRTGLFPSVIVLDR